MQYTFLDVVLQNPLSVKENYVAMFHSRKSLLEVSKKLTKCYSFEALIEPHILRIKRHIPAGNKKTVHIFNVDFCILTFHIMLNNLKQSREKSA